MVEIGVVFPSANDKRSFWKRFFSKNKYESFVVEEYGIDFLCVYDNQNCSKIFKKQGVENMVVMTDKDVEKCNFRIFNGERMYRKMLPEFVRKTAKSSGKECTVTVVDKELTLSAVEIVEKLCSVFSTITLCTDKTYDAARVCDRLFDKMGVVINVVDNRETINTDIAVVLEDCGNDYSPDCLIINKNCKRSCGKVISDFYIPFDTRPPFGMSNLVFAECIEFADKNMC